MAALADLELVTKILYHYAAYLFPPSTIHLKQVYPYLSIAILIIVICAGQTLFILLFLINLLRDIM